MESKRGDSKSERLKKRKAVTPHHPTKWQETELRQRRTFRKWRYNLAVYYANTHGSCVNSAKSAKKVGQLLGNSSRCFLLGSHLLSFTAADYHRCWHLHPTSNENAHDKHLRAATTEGNSPLENNSIKGRCDNSSMSNAVHAIMQSWTLLATLLAAHELLL